MTGARGHGVGGDPVAEEQPLCCSRALGAPCTVLYLRATEARNCFLVASPQAEGSESGPWGLSPRLLPWPGHCSLLSDLQRAVPLQAEASVGLPPR